MKEEVRRKEGKRNRNRGREIAEEKAEGRREENGRKEQGGGRREGGRREEG